MGNLFYKKSTLPKNIAITVFIVICCVCGIVFGNDEIRTKIFNNIRYRKEQEMYKKTEKLLPTWDLKDLYNGIDDEQLAADRKSLKKEIDEFNSEYKGKVKGLNSKKFYTALKEYEDISEKLEKIGSFAYLLYAQNVNDEKNVLFYQQINEELTNISTKLIFFTLEINKLSEADLNEKLKNNRPLIRQYYYYLQNLRAFRPHQLSEELETLLSEKSITSRDAWVRLFDETLNGMVFKFKGKQLNEPQILNIINRSTDSAEREEAGKVFGRTLGEHIKTFAFITNTLAKDKAISDKWRKFKTPISARNLSNMIDDEVVDNLYNSVRENYSNISHRYYKLKAKMLGKEFLSDSDRNAPLPFDNPKIYSWKETVKIVLDAYYKFSPKMYEVGQLFFENNWIDVPTRQGKMSGAFAHPTVPSAHPYLLLNFQGTENDVKTLAHELGHGVHQYLAKNNGYFNSDTPLTVAETASVFDEQLVFRYMLENETNNKNKITILSHKIEDMINTVVRQIAFLEFEKRVHDERQKGELTVDQLNNIWLDVQQESLGDVFKFPEEYKYYWAYITHFIHSPFYVYAYAFGDCLVNSLYMNYMENPDGFEEKYIDLLKAGGSDSYINLLKPFDLDPTNKDFWNNGMKLITDLIDQLETLMEEEHLK